MSFTPIQQLRNISTVDTPVVETVPAVLKRYLERLDALCRLPAPAANSASSLIEALALVLSSSQSELYSYRECVLKKLSMASIDEVDLLFAQTSHLLRRPELIQTQYSQLFALFYAAEFLGWRPALQYIAERFRLPLPIDPGPRVREVSLRTQILRTLDLTESAEVQTFLENYLLNSEVPEFRGLAVRYMATQ